MTGGGRKTPTTPILLVEHRLGWLVIRISTIPVRGGRTEIATRPRLLVVAALFRPGPLTRIRTPPTPRFLSTTTTLTTPRRPTDSDRGCTMRFGQLATGGAIGPRTRVGAVARLFAVFASDWSPTTVATLSNAPGEVGFTTIVIVARPPFSIVPRLQRTTRPPVHVPWLLVTETKVVAAGSASATRTLVAVSGPAFRTVSV